MLERCDDEKSNSLKVIFIKYVTENARLVTRLAGPECKTSGRASPI